MKRVSTLLLCAAVAATAACGKKDGDGGQAGAADSTGSAAAAPMATDSASATGQAPTTDSAGMVVQNGGPVTTASGAPAGHVASGDTVYGNTGPAGPSAPGGKDTLVTKPRP